MNSGDRYEILRELGRGAMADVFLVRDRELDRNVALKILKAEFAGNPGIVARMLREARTIASMGVLYQQALKDYDKSIGINPRNGETVRRRGILHLLLERYREALIDMNEALRLSPNLEPLVRPKITFCKSKLGTP